VGYNANVNMEFLGSPDKIIAGFAPELFGVPLVDGDVLDTSVYKQGENTYYQWSLKPHRTVVATATGNRVRLDAATERCSAAQLTSAQHFLVSAALCARHKCNIALVSTT
jgi:hypothetical protein